jgi:hypothetical protein
VPKNPWPDDPALVERINKGCHKVWGDRRQQLVIVGGKARRCSPPSSKLA